MLSKMWLVLNLHPRITLIQHSTIRGLLVRCLLVIVLNLMLRTSLRPSPLGHPHWLLGLLLLLHVVLSEHLHEVNILFLVVQLGQDVVLLLWGFIFRPRTSICTIGAKILPRRHLDLPLVGGSKLLLVDQSHCFWRIYHQLVEFIFRIVTDKRCRTLLAAIACRRLRIVILSIGLMTKVLHICSK